MEEINFCPSNAVGKNQGLVKVMQLRGLSFKDLLLQRAKKMILDMTSVKFETIIYVAYGMWVGKISDWAGLAYMAAAVGIKEFADFKEKQSVVIGQQILTGGQYSKKGGGEG